MDTIRKCDACCHQTVELDGPASVLLPSAVPAYTVSILTGAEAAEAKRLLPGEGRGTGVGAGSPFMARVLDARELHGPGSDRSCLHVELDITGSQVRCCAVCRPVTALRVRMLWYTATTLSAISVLIGGMAGVVCRVTNPAQAGCPPLALSQWFVPQRLHACAEQITYEAGDHVAVYAENSPATVTAAAACLGVPLDTVFTLDLPQGDTQQLSPPFLGASYGADPMYASFPMATTQSWPTNSSVCLADERLERWACVLASRQHVAPWCTCAPS